MIYVDPRGGSCELVQPLKALGLPVDDSTYLPAGDLAFEGRGVGGAPVLVGIEYKKLPDFIASARTERLQGIQLPGMVDALDNKWLFIEGELLFDSRGKLLKRTHRGLRPLEGGMDVGELLKRVFVFHLSGGLTPWWTRNQGDTVVSVQMLYRTWTDKNLDQHRSHLGAYTAPTLVPVSDERAVFMRFPHVGFKASLAVERHFEGNVKRAVNAPAAEWAEIETRDDKGKVRRIGLANATKIVAFLNRGQQ